MKKPFDTFSLYFTLETGAFIVGTLGWMGTILIIVKFSLAYREAIEDTEYDEVELDSRQSTAFGFIPCIIVGVFYLFLYITLLVGIKKRNSCLLLPFLITLIAGLVLSTLFCTLLLTNLPSSPPVGVYIWFGIGAPIGICISMCMISLYRKIQNEEFQHKLDQYLMKPKKDLIE